MVWSYAGAGAGDIRGYNGAADTRGLTFTGVQNLVVSGGSGSAGKLVVLGGAFPSLTQTGSGLNAGTLALNGNTVSYSALGQITVLAPLANVTATTTAPPAAIGSTTVGTRVGALGLTLPTGFLSGTSLVTATAPSGVSLAFLAPTASLVVDSVSSTLRTIPVAITSGLTSGTLDFGKVTMGTNGSLTFTLTSTLATAVTGLTATLVSADPEFSLTSTPSPSLAALGSTTTGALGFAAPISQLQRGGTLSIAGTVLGSPFSFTAPSSRARPPGSSPAARSG